MEEIMKKILAKIKEILNKIVQFISLIISQFLVWKCLEELLKIHFTK
jgi:hypothetical protein